MPARYEKPDERRVGRFRVGFGILTGMPIAVGSRLRCAQCETEVLVVKGTEGEISCCGQPLAPKES
jgi:hypothetical protein